MRTWRLAGLLAISLLVFTAVPSEAGTWHGGGGGWHGGGGPRHHFHGGGARFFVGVGPVWPAPWWYYPPAPVIVESPPPVIVQSAPVYAAPPSPAPQYWYFCQSFNAYYPQTPTCPEPWVRVPARPY
jgi:hypothetical protein